ncbi:MAG: CARDB domain-containing protein [Armatimonadota bacterium]
MGENTVKSAKYKVLEKRIRPLKEQEIKELLKAKKKKKELTNLFAAKMHIFGTYAGYPVTISSYVVNDSKIDSGPFTVDVDTGRGIEKVKIQELKAGEGIEISLSRSTDWGYSQSIKASCNIDPMNRLEETNEKDNFIWDIKTFYPVNQPPGAPPDK